MRKTFYRFLLFIGIATLIPYLLFWIFTGQDYLDVLDEINAM